MIIPMDLLSDLFGRITGNLGGVPTLLIMAVPFIIGLIIGFFIKKSLKIAIIAAIILVIATYFGFFGLTWSTLGNVGMDVIQGGILLFGMLPLGIGLVIGLIIGFIFA
jgi:glucan phosphoethanolaminetransferase (alkaline phosphatase superfamily)